MSDKTTIGVEVPISIAPAWGLTSLVQPRGAGGVLPGPPAARVDAGLDAAVGARLPALPLHLLLGHQEPLLQPLVLQLQPPDLLVQLLHHLLHLHVARAGRGAGPVPPRAGARHQLLQPTAVLHQLHQLGGQPDQGTEWSITIQTNTSRPKLSLAWKPRDSLSSSFAERTIKQKRLSVLMDKYTNPKDLFANCLVYIQVCRCLL